MSRLMVLTGVAITLFLGGLARADNHDQQPGFYPEGIAPSSVDRLRYFTEQEIAQLKAELAEVRERIRRLENRPLEPKVSSAPPH